MSNEVKGQVTKATMLPIIGILVAGVVAVIAVPEINRGLAEQDRLLSAAIVAVSVAAVFGLSIVWAQSILARVSSVKVIDAIRGSAASALAMQWVWLSINFLLLLILAAAYNAALFFNGFSQGVFGVQLASEPLRWSGLPLVLLALLMIGQTLAFVELRAKTVIPVRVVEPAA